MRVFVSVTLQFLHLSIKFIYKYLNHQPEGTSCPVPGRIARGEWRCEKQQIPISDNGDLETYPGDLGIT